MFHVSLLLILTLTAASTKPFLLEDTQTSIQIASSRHKNQIQMVLSINGTIGQQISLTTQALSSQHAAHLLILGEKRVEVKPAMHDEIVVFNYREGRQYFVALEHGLAADGDIFLPLRIEAHGVKKELLLVALDLRMSQIDQSLLYRCHNLLVEVQVDQQQELVRMTFFSVDKKESMWQVEGDLVHQWRHYHEKMYFGGAVKKINQKIKIILKNNKYCEFNAMSLPEKAKIPLNNKKYHNLDQILDWAPAFKVQQTIKSVDEEL